MCELSVNKESTTGIHIESKWASELGNMIDVPGNAPASQQDWLIIVSEKA